MRTDTVYEEAPDVLSLDDIVASGIVLEWYEAVALMQQVCGTLSSRGPAPAGFPNGSSITLTPDGEVGVVALFRELAPATSAARMLSDLLSGDVPVRLRLAVSQGLEAEPHAETLANFAETLNYFARPDGQALLREVHRRASAASDWFSGTDAADATPVADSSLPDPPSADSGPAETTPRRAPGPAADVTGQPPPVAGVPWRELPENTKPLETLVEKFEEEERKRRNRLKRRRALLFAGCAAVLPIVGAVWWSVASALASPEAPGVAAAARRVAAAATRAASSVTERVTSTIAHTPRGVPDEARTAGVSRPRPTPPTRAKGRRRPASVAPSSERAATGPLAADAEFHPVPPMTALSRAALDIPGASRSIPASALPEAVEEVIHSASTPDVRPPVALRPHLPAEPADDAAAAPRSVIELVVAPSGMVDSVRLLSKPRTFKDVMLLTAAKSWIFKPATLHGQPVRFRHRIVITVP